MFISFVTSGRSRLGEFPWQGIIFTTVNAYVGSGVLIDQYHFLTVAHRLKRFPFVFIPVMVVRIKIKPLNFRTASFKVRMGDWDTASPTSEPLTHIELNVATVFIHPNYNSTNLQNSIAILRLVKPMPLGRIPTVSTACLPSESLSSKNTF